MHDHDDESGRAASRLRAAAAIDREDLLAILAMRFGDVPGAVCDRIAACHDLTTLERLVLVAANVPTWEDFLAELDRQGDDFKVVGARFDPLSQALPSSHASGRPPHAPPDAPTSSERDEGALGPQTHLIQIQPRSKEH